MSNDLDLPPFTSIPTEVRDRVRRKVQERVRRPRSYRRPIAVAASVAVLAAAAVFVFAKGSGPAEPARPSRTDVTLDRCWAAIRDTGAGLDNYPDRSTWKVPVVSDSAPYSDLITVGISAGDKKFFCETTETAVSVTSPSAQLHYAEGTRTALMMLTPNGTLAGVIDPSWPSAYITIRDRTQVREQPRDGMFIAHVNGSLSDAQLLARAGEKVLPTNPDMDYSGIELPKPPTLGVSVRDRPPAPQDRTSERGKALGDCLAAAGAEYSTVVMDPDTYGPGALVKKDGATLVMGRSESRLVFCAQMPVSGAGDLVIYTPGPSLSEVDADRQPVAFYTGPVNFARGARSTLGGVVPPDIVKAEIRFANGTTVSCEIVNRTFELVVPDDVGVTGDNKPHGPLAARLFTASGAIVHDGPLTVWNPN